MKTGERTNLPKLASSALFAVLTGCAGSSPAPQIVKVPVYTSCVTTAPARPQYEFSSLTQAATNGDKILALARDWPRGRAYELELEALVEGCK